jgi:hypothetical protein
MRRCSGVSLTIPFFVLNRREDAPAPGSPMPHVGVLSAPSKPSAIRRKSSALSIDALISPSASHLISKMHIHRLGRLLVRGKVPFATGETRVPCR